MNRVRVLFCLGLGVATLASATVVQNCTNSSSLAGYIAQFGSAGCVDQNLLFSNFHYTRLTSPAVSTGSIAVVDPPGGLSFSSPHWAQPSSGIAISTLSYTVTALTGTMLTGGALNLSGAHGLVGVTQLCLSGCSSGLLMLGSTAYPSLTKSFAPTRSINLMTVVTLGKSARLSSFSQLFTTTNTPTGPPLSTPEPAAFSLGAAGLLGLGLLRRMKRSRA
jgi:hypothetical protein